MSGFHLRGVVLPTEDSYSSETTDIWIVNGRIRTSPVPGATTIAESGYFLPGLVDAHCHVGYSMHGVVDLPAAAEQARTHRDTGALLIRDCGSPLDTRPLQEQLDLPRIIRAGRHLARPKRYIPELGLEINDPADLPAEVARQAAYGDGWIKLVGDWIDRAEGDLAPLWPDDVLTEAIAVAHAHGAKVTAHVFGEQALPSLINAGIDCIEHGSGLTDETIGMMAAADVALVPTLINIDNFPSIAARATRFPTYAQHMRNLYDKNPHTISKAIEAGIRVCAGTDAGGGIQHGRITDEINALHRIGMTTEQALSAASWEARNWLGYEGIVDGAPADIVVYSEDPRRDLAVLRHPRMVVLRGRIY